MAQVRIDDATDQRTALADAISSLGLEGRFRPGDRVFVKPNLTYPVHRPGVTTSPRMLRAILGVLRDAGCSVTVGEADGGYGSWQAALAFRGHGLPAICDEFGSKLVDLSTAPTVDVELPSYRRGYRLPAILLEDTDTFVTVPVPKIHAIVGYSGAVKNQWGCIPDAMRLKLHPHFTEIVWDINRRLRAAVVFGDAEYMLDRNGPMWGDPVYMNRVVVADDILAFDVAVSSHLMGLEPARISYLADGPPFDYSWQAERIDDRSTGPSHQFALQRTLRNRLAAAAFTRQWAVDLAWDSGAGRAAHRVLYAFAGNPVERERHQLLHATQPRREDRHV